MGLDMYLYASRNIGGAFNKDDQGRAAIAALVGFEPVEDHYSFEVKAPVGYWRKANAIHRWFVEHVQHGKDDCEDYFVSREDLETLRAACEEVLGTIETVTGSISTGSTHYQDGRVEYHTRPGEVIAQPAIAERVLPTQGGFFFGQTEYDEYYIGDLQKTKALIDQLLSDERLAKCDFYYRSSW